VAAVDDFGGLVASAQCPLRSHRPEPGRHEQDPEDWKTAVARACRATLRQLEAAPTVGGVAVCGTSGTFLLGDEHGRPLSPAIMYDDTRAAGLHTRVNAAWRRCAERAGYQIQPTWSLPKLVWMLEHMGGASIGRVYHCPDLVGTWLVGHAVATDSSHALKTGYDLLDLAWPYEVFEALGIPPGVLPPVVRPGALLGHVSPTGAAATGLPEGTPLLAGMTDGCAAQIAAGALRSGQWNSALGTTLVLKGATAELLRDPAGALYSHRHPDGGWLPGGASNAGAGVLACRFPDADLAAMDRAAAARGPTDVVAYPLAQPGERFPFAAADAEPFQLGKPRDDVEAFMALLQGVAFVERLSLAYVEALGADVHGPLTATGGATRSPVWTQLRADVLGRPVRVPRHPDSAVGMAILAAAGNGSVTEAADRMVHLERVFEPRQALTERYATIYERMLDELERRNYISPDLAARARAA
jgi:D-ribulokinase